MSRIITIGREFGSGGREIGKRLSDELGIAYYDNEIISQIADRTKLAEGYVPVSYTHLDVYKRQCLQSVELQFW